MCGWGAYTFDRSKAAKLLLKIALVRVVAESRDDQCFEGIAANVGVIGGDVYHGGASVSLEISNRSPILSQIKESEIRSRQETDRTYRSWGPLIAVSPGGHSSPTSCDRGPAASSRWEQSYLGPCMRRDGGGSGRGR